MRPGGHMSLQGGGQTSLTNMVSGLATAAVASFLRNGDPTLPVCIASSILSSHLTREDCSSIFGCSSLHGGVRSCHTRVPLLKGCLCGRRARLRPCVPCVECRRRSLAMEDHGVHG